MNSKILYITMISIVLLFVGCSEKNEEQETSEQAIEINTEQETNEQTMEINTEDATYIDPDELFIGMSRQDIIEKWGSPIDEIGAGVSILIYMKDADNMLTLYFDTNDNLSTVNLIDKNDETKTILE